jgi:hypothetical protein
MEQVRKTFIPAYQVPVPREQSDKNSFTSYAYRFNPFALFAIRSRLHITTFCGDYYFNVRRFSGWLTGSPETHAPQPTPFQAVSTMPAVMLVSGNKIRTHFWR